MKIALQAVDWRTHAAAIVVAGAVCYASGLSGTYVFDDIQLVAGNGAIRSLWPPFGWLGFCPARPVVYFTFAVNYALHGTAVAGYHVVNIAVHLTTALGLFGLIRRTLRLPSVARRYRDAADGLAAAIALVWVVHPLGTQAVTYIYQRLESLAAMFAVLTLYCFVRGYGSGSRSGWGWTVGAAVCCYLALLSKESVIALPLLVLAYDRLFLSRSWRDVLPRRRLHAALFCGWGVALGLMFASADDYEQAGILGVAGLTPFTYALSQSGVILHYLRLCFIPIGLCLDYGWPVAAEPRDYVLQTIVVTAMLVTTLFGFVRAKLWSFPALAFFLLLAPTSSIIPIHDLAFEHRMYLPLACVVTLVACGALEFLQRWTARTMRPDLVRRSTTIGVGVICLVFGTLTTLRNRDYTDGPTMWFDCIEKAPHNPRPYDVLATYYLINGDLVESRRWLSEGLRIDPRYSFQSRVSLINLLIDDGQLDEAQAWLEGVPVETIQHPESLLLALGRLRVAQGRPNEAEQSFSAVLDMRPAFHSQARSNLGVLLDRQGRGEEALKMLVAAVTENPGNVAAYVNLGSALARRGRFSEAVPTFEHALELDPQNQIVQQNLAQARLDLRAQETGTTAILATP